MPKLIIDNREITVPEGTKVIDAAERLGIMIPRFCYHPALGSVGACRVCAVKFMDGPVKGIDMSCMVTAEDGMVVSTTDADAIAFRRFVIECLMLNHPLDCPVCDEGGHCLLQDQTIAGDHGTRRYQGRKRTHHNQDLGVFVSHEMNRCIHCFRCRRYYQEYTGYRDLGAMQIGSRTYFGMAENGGALASPFAGNLIDICPTGVYTDKPSRFKGRRWNLSRGGSVCLHCALGCNTTVNARYREVLRQEARINEEVNGYFICDRGRYGFDYANHPDRIRRPMIRNAETASVDPIDAAARKLSAITDKYGAESVLCLGSTRCSLETQAALRRLCRQMEIAPPRFFMDSDMAVKTRTAVDYLSKDVAVGLGDISRADFILCLGADPLNETPMLALALRQAQQNGALVAVADPRPVSLPLTFIHLPVKTPDIVQRAAAIAQKAFDHREVKSLPPAANKFLNALKGAHVPNADAREKIDIIGRQLAKAENPMIICGTEIVDNATVAFAGDLAHLFRLQYPNAGLFYLMSGPNAFGGALMEPADATTSVLDTLLSGDIKALILVEQDPFWQVPDRARLERAIDAMAFKLVLDYLPTSATEKADILIPAATIFDGSKASYVNCHGRVQTILPVHQGGTPLAQSCHGNHPPRTFADQTPGLVSHASHEILSELYAAFSEDAPVSVTGDYKDELGIDPDTDQSILSAVPDNVFASPLSRENEKKEHLEFILSDQTFGTEELSCYSRWTRQAEPAPCFLMHPNDANRLGLSDGDRIAIGLRGDEVTMDVHIHRNMATGVVITPRHHRVAWQKLRKTPFKVTDRKIHKLQGTP